MNPLEISIGDLGTADVAEMQQLIFGCRSSDQGDESPRPSVVQQPFKFMPCSYRLLSEGGTAWQTAPSIPGLTLKVQAERLPPDFGLGGTFRWHKNCVLPRLNVTVEGSTAAELELEAEAAAENERRRPEGDAEITDDLDDLPGGVDDVTDPSRGSGPQVALEWCRADRDAPRDLASRLLVSYVSALTVHPVGLRGFAAAALDAYELGLPASTLARSLRPEEFDVEGSRRGMFGSSADATKFFSLFLTTAYVTAQEEGLLPAFTPGESQTTAQAAVAAIVVLIK